MRRFIPVKIYKIELFFCKLNKDINNKHRIKQTTNRTNEQTVK